MLWRPCSRPLRPRPQLEELRVRLLGKKGELTAVLKQMGKLSAGGASCHGPAGKLPSGPRSKEMLEERKAAMPTPPLLEAQAGLPRLLDVTIPGRAGACWAISIP